MWFKFELKFGLRFSGYSPGARRIEVGTVTVIPNTPVMPNMKVLLRVSDARAGFRGFVDACGRGVPATYR
jgi:hypothetical protein